MGIKYWLMKSEPSDYSFEDLKGEEGSIAEWDGVRNYQARNLLRDEIEVGDRVIYYHSNSKPSGAVGTAFVVKDGYPDHTAWDPKSDHPDPRSTEENPIWYMVDIRSKRRVREPLTLEMLSRVADLKDMMLMRKGSRLSVQPVT